MSNKKTRVIILDDHHSIVDGYRYRLSLTPEIEVVDALSYGEDLEPTLAQQSADVLLLDVHVPTNKQNASPYPILYLIPRLLQIYPHLNILVISMIVDRGLIRAVMDAGANGYVIKDDKESIENLGSIVLKIADGEIHFSAQAQELLARSQAMSDGEALTPRQIEVLSLCLSYPDASTSDLAQKMGIANSTLRNLLSGAYLKLDVRTRMAAVDKARKLGMITPPAPEYLLKRD